MVGDVAEKINKIVTTNDVVLFMKGTKCAPMCGYSDFVAQALKDLGVDFYDVNVLDDAAIRDGIKQYSDWPTIPQLFIKGNFVGGCDIVKQMRSDDSLLSMLKENGVIFAIVD